MSEKFIVTEAWINENASYHGPRGNAWKAAQKDLLGVGNHRGWIERAVGVQLSNEDRKKFESYRGTAKQKVHKTRDSETEPDWMGNCLICDASPIVPATGMCGPCTFGEAETAGGNW